MTDAPPVLTRARTLVEPALRKAIGTLDRRLRAPAEYHFGWTEADGTPVDGTGVGGKAVRPALTVLGAEAAGGDAAMAVPGAVALELVHNFSLIHDDIMDGDRTRRHRPTVWALFGVADAVIVADALHTLAFQVLLDEAGPEAARAIRRLADATAAMIVGQAQDTALDEHGATVAACESMHLGKTGALLGGAVGVGAVLAGAGDDLVNVLTGYGLELGLSFQAIDDLLGIWGDPAVTGKPTGNDLRERKRSLPIAIALEAGGPLAARLRSAYAGNMTEAPIRMLTEQLTAAGIVEQVEARANAHLAAALQMLDGHPLDEPAKLELHELARFVVERRY